jgi:hypothetical protein
MRVALDHAGKWLLNLSHFRTALGADRSQPYGLIATGAPRVTTSTMNLSAPAEAFKEVSGP